MSDVGIGAVLQEARTAQGRGVSEAAAATSMRAQQIEAMEQDRFEMFGGDVYAKGFLKSYATWLGLDPEPLLDRYRRFVQHDSMDPLALTSVPVTREARSDMPRWLLTGASVLAVLGLVVGLVNLADRAPSPADTPTVAADPPDPVDTPTPAVESTPTPTPTPTPVFVGVELTLAFEGDSWVSVTVDGQAIQEGLFVAGDVLDLVGDEEVIVRIGNAGGVRGLLNGESVGPFGNAGQVVNIRFTDHGFEPV